MFNFASKEITIPVIQRTISIKTLALIVLGVVILAAGVYYVVITVRNHS